MTLTMTPHIVATAAILALGACGASTSSEPAAAGSGAMPTQSAIGSMGTLEIGDTTYEFRITQCDLAGGRADGILLRGTGTAPDGRRIRVEVERLTPGMDGPGFFYERVTMDLAPDGAAEGERGEWEATRSSFDNERWTRGSDWTGGSDVREPADGPLFRISGTELVADDPYLYTRLRSPRYFALQSEMSQSGTTPERGQELRAGILRERELDEAARQTLPGVLRAACPSSSAHVTP